MNIESRTLFHPPYTKVIHLWDGGKYNLLKNILPNRPLNKKGWEGENFNRMFEVLGE